MVPSCTLRVRVLARVGNRGLLAAAHKAVFFKDEIKWCGRIYSGEATRPDPDRVYEFVELRRPETDGEPVHFIHAVNWVGLATLELAELEAILRSVV